MIIEIDDFPHNGPNGLGVTFNWVALQMLRHPDHTPWVNITKPNNPYRSAEHGPNPWDYYFDQPAPDGQTEKAYVHPEFGLGMSGHCEWSVLHQRAANERLAHRFRLRPEIQEQVDNFRANHFRGKVLGVHLRGTDKLEEYRPMSDGAIAKAVGEAIDRLKPDTVFLQTDDIDYWKLMQRFNAVSLQIPRSKTNLHHGTPRGPYESGKWAVIDGFLGAACDWYFRTPSNFSTISIIMGRHLELGLINKHCVIEPFSPEVNGLLGL